MRFCAQWSHSQMCTSVPQMLVARILTRISVSLISGISTSLISKPFYGLAFRTAFICEFYLAWLFLGLWFSIAMPQRLTAPLIKIGHPILKPCFFRGLSLSLLFLLFFRIIF